MNTTGYEATATRLPDCRVLVAGGNAGTGTGADPGLSTAEIFDPQANGGIGAFTLTGSLSVPRKRHAAVLLQGGPQDGRVLITGGNGNDFQFYASAEIFDPQANGGVGAFISGGTMSRARGGGHTSTRLLDGRVLVAGGSSCPCPTPADPADIYDPNTGTWSVTGPTQEGLAVHTATLLGNGKVLIAGGGSGGGPLTLGTAELYDPTTNAFTFTTSLNVARKFHAASLLLNGTVLISGGTNDTTRFTSTEIYDPVALTWTLGPPMNIARVTHTSTRLVNGDVLVTGGSDAGPTAELYSPSTEELALLNPASLWIGLKNSDDQGTQFDLRAEVYINDGVNNTLVAAGQTLCITNVTRNPDQAKNVTVPFGSISDGAFESGDTLSLKILTRIGTNANGTKCAGPGGSHNNAVGLRLYYDATNRASGFGAELTPNPPKNFYLHSNTNNIDFFDATPPTATAAKFKDSAAVNFAGGNLWQTIGTWSMTLP
jgi:hypothetical protein